MFILFKTGVQYTLFLDPPGTTWNKMNQDCRNFLHAYSTVQSKFNLQTVHRKSTCHSNLIVIFTFFATKRDGGGERMYMHTLHRCSVYA